MVSNLPSSFFDDEGDETVLSGGDDISIHKEKGWTTFHRGAFQLRINVPGGPRNILVGDGSVDSTDATRIASEIAEKYGLKIGRALPHGVNFWFEFAGPPPRKKLLF
jgi:hypothetical protein